MATYDGYADDTIDDFAGSITAPVGFQAPPPAPPPAPIPPPFSGPTLRADAAADPLGAGMIRPFRRTEHQDYATDSGTPLVISCVEQVLGTPLGTLPWEPGFGSELFRLRHKSQDPTFLDLCRIYSAEAIARWEPRATVISCERELNSLPLGRSSYVGLIIKVRIGGRVFSARARV